MNPLRYLKNKFLRDTATLQLGAIINAFLNIVSSVTVAHLLGADLQGVFVVAISLYSFSFFLLNLGLVQATVNQVAAATARGQEGKAADWLAFLAKAYILMGALLFGGGYFVLPRITEVWMGLFASSDLAVDPVQLGIWAWWLTAIPLIDMPRAVAAAAFQGTRRMVALAQIENGTEAVRSFLVIVGAIITADPVGPIVGMILAYAIGSVLSIDRYRRARSDGSYALPGVREIARDMRHIPLSHGIRLGIKVGILRQIDALSMKILPPLIIQTFGSSKWVAYYRIARSLMDIPMMMMQGISRTILPVLSQLKGVRDMEGFRRVYLKATLIGGGVIGTGVLLALPFIPLLAGLIYPEDYRDPVFTLSLILAVGFVSVAFALSIDSFYIVADELKMGITLGIAGMVVAIPASCVLAYHYPETGAAWGTVCSMSVGFVHYAYIGSYFLRKRHLEVHQPAEAA